MGLLAAYKLSALFIGSFLFGETAIIAASFLAAHGFWSLATVFGVSLAGTLASDVVWFFLGGKIMAFLRRFKWYKEHSARLLAALEKMSGQRPFFLLFFIKFLYGTRVLTIMYLSHRKIRFSIFFLFDLLGTVVWLAAMMVVGWLAGQGATNFAPMLSSLEYTLPLIIVVALALKYGATWLTKKMTKE